MPAACHLCLDVYNGDMERNDRVVKSDAEWKQLLNREQYRVARKAGTERAFSGKYYNSKEAGEYICICCGLPLFSSEHKFDSRTGWPSYWQPLANDAVLEHEDRAFGDAQNRGDLRALRCPPGACLSRWPAADRATLLHQLGLARL